MSSGDTFNFKAKLVSKYIRIFFASFRNKAAIHEHLKPSNIRHYLVSDGENQIKVVIRDFCGSTALRVRI